MRKYTFPARHEEIERCCDINQLREWKQQFENSLNQMESDYGSLENVPEKIYKYAKANLYNLNQIKFRIRKLSGPVTSAGALKAFHDAVKTNLPNEYDAIVQLAKNSLGRPDDDWNELIKPRKK